MSFIPWVHMGIGLLSTLVAVPLVLNKVPMNRHYGIRVPKAFGSDENWYRLNAYGGKLFLVFGLFLLVYGILTRNLTPPATSIWTPVFFIAPLLALVPVVLLINARAQKLPDR